MSCKAALLLLPLMLSAQAWGASDRYEKLVSSVEERSFFSAGFAAGGTSSGLQNSGGSYSGYTSTNLGVNFDFRLFGMDTGQVSLFVSYLMGEGKNNADSNNTLKSQETVGGLKIGITQNFYISAAMGNNKLKLGSASNSTELNLSHSISQFGLGCEFQINSSLYWGLEALYRTGAVSKNENPSLTSNTTYQGTTALLKLIWSPAAITNSYTSKSKNGL